MWWCMLQGIAGSASALRVARLEQDSSLNDNISFYSYSNLVNSFRIFKRRIRVASHIINFS